MIKILSILINNFVKKKGKSDNKTGKLQITNDPILDAYDFSIRDRVAKIYGYKSYDLMYEDIHKNSYDIFNIDKKYVGCIYVPKNEKGISDCYWMQFDTDDVEEYPIEQEEFDLLYSLGAIDLITDKTGVWIQEYEEETIEGSNIVEALAVLELFDKEHKYSITKALLAASKYKTKAEIYF